MTSVRLRGVSRTLGLSPRRRAARGAASPAIVQDGLVAEWRFDDGAGQVLTDYASRRHGQLGSGAGTDSNDPTWVAGGLSFAGAHTSGDNDYVDTSAWSFPSPEYHVDLVGRFTGSAAPGVDFVMIGGGTDDNTTPFVTFREGATGAINARVGNGAAETTQLFTGTVFDDGWHHLAFDYDGVDMTLRIDNGAGETKTFSRTPNAQTGATRFGTFFSPSLIPFTGILGYCAVYDRTFSAGENAQQNASLAAIMAARGIALP
jgi:hypothetical protein